MELQTSNTALVPGYGREIELPEAAKPVNKWVAAVITGVTTLISLGVGAYSSSREDQIQSQQNAQSEFDSFISAIENQQYTSQQSTETDNKRIYIIIGSLILIAVLVYFLFIRKRKGK